MQKKQLQTNPLSVDLPTTREYALVAAITLSALAVRLWALCTTINWYNAEPFFYLHDVIRLFNKTTVFPLMDNHPSGYQYLLTALVWLFRVDDLVIFGRLFSLTLGVATVPVLYFFTRRIYGTLTAAGATAMLALYDTHVLLSVNSLNFAPFYAALLGGLLVMHGAGEARSISWPRLLAGSVLLGVAHFIRFESWLVIAPLFVWLLIAKRPAKAIVFVFINSAYPLVYMVFAWKKWGTPFPFLAVSGGIDTTFSGWLDPAVVLVWPKELWWALGAIPLLAGLVGAAISLIRRRLVVPGYFALFLAFYLFRTMRHRFIFAGEFPRYDVLLVLFLLPLVFLPAVLAARLSRLKIVGPAVLVVLVTAFAMTSRQNYRFQTSVDWLADPPAHLATVIEWSKDNLKAADHVCLDHGDHPELLHVFIEAKGIETPAVFFVQDPGFASGRDGAPSEQALYEKAWRLIQEKGCNIAFGKAESPMARAALESGMECEAEVALYRVFRRGGAFVQ